MKKHEVYALLYLMVFIVFIAVAFLFHFGALYFRAGDSAIGLKLYGIGGISIIVAALCYCIFKPKD